MTGVHVRPLAPGDDAAAADLSARVFEEGWSAEELARERARSIARVLVAEKEGLLLGYVVAWVVDDEAEILTIAVDPDARRRGVGRALVEAALSGCARASLEVREGNRAARALYEGFGFAEVGRRARYYQDGEDALLMAWTRSS